MAKKKKEEQPKNKPNSVVGGPQIGEARHQLAREAQKKKEQKNG